MDATPISIKPPAPPPPSPNPNPNPQPAQPLNGAPKSEPEPVNGAPKREADADPSAKIHVEQLCSSSAAASLVAIQVSPNGKSVEEEVVGNNCTTPIRKKKKVEEGGEGNECKNCACKKSQCLKLYCPCFAAGVYCSEKCGCRPCYNKSRFDEILKTCRNAISSKNQRTSTPKKDRKSDANAEIADNIHNSPASTQPKRGCSCKKSGCVKKYCECFQAGGGCSIGCRCEVCVNPYGRNEKVIAEDCKHFLFTGANLDDSADEYYSSREVSPVSKESSFQQGLHYITRSSLDRQLFSAPAPAPVPAPQQWQPTTWHSMKKPTDDRTSDIVEYRSSNDWKLSKHEENYSIARCIQILNVMTDLSQHEKSLAPDVFLQPSNREIFVSLSIDVRTLWLKRKIQQLA